MWRHNEESCHCYLSYILFILKQSLDPAKCILSTLYVCLVNTQTSFDLFWLSRSQGIESISYGRRQSDVVYFQYRLVIKWPTLLTIKLHSAATYYNIFHSIDRNSYFSCYLFIVTMHKFFLAKFSFQNANKPRAVAAAKENMKISKADCHF